MDSCQPLTVARRIASTFNDANQAVLPGHVAHSAISGAGRGCRVRMLASEARAAKPREQRCDAAAVS
jgi:hypothetical protein